MSPDDNHTSRSHPHRLDPEDYRRPGQPCHITIATSKQRRFLIDGGVPELIVETLDRSAARHGCDIMAYCILPDHVHIFVRVKPEGGDIAAFLHSFKTWTGRQLALRGAAAPVWQRSYHDRHTRCRDNVAAVIAYVMRNPVREGLCPRPEDWPYCEYRLRIGGPGRTSSGR